MNDSGAVPEFSRTVELSRLGEEEAVYNIEAAADERAALAIRFGLVEMQRLEAVVKLRWLKSPKRLGLRSNIHAVVVQTCVVSLDPVENAVEEEVEILFEPAGDSESPQEIVLNTTEDAEPLLGDTLDIGELIAMETALSLDPYPRRKDLAGSDDAGEGDGAPGPESPFRVLARLKQEK